VWWTAYEKYHWNCIAPSFKSGRASIMVWGAFTTSSKCFLVLIPLDKRSSQNFIDVVYESVLEPYYYHHDNHEDLILMEDVAPVHRNNVAVIWKNQLGCKSFNG
jgi:hypothetical protein